MYLRKGLRMDRSWSAWPPLVKYTILMYKRNKFKIERQHCNFIKYSKRERKFNLNLIILYVKCIVNILTNVLIIYYLPGYRPVDLTECSSSRMRCSRMSACITKAKTYKSKYASIKCKNDLHKRWHWKKTPTQQHNYNSSLEFLCYKKINEKSTPTLPGWSYKGERSENSEGTPYMCKKAKM